MRSKDRLCRSKQIGLSSYQFLIRQTYRKYSGELTTQDINLPEKNLILSLANNKYADWAMHPGSLISAFMFRYPESTISKLASCKMYILYLVSFGKVRHNSRIESWLRSTIGTLRVVLCTKKLHFVSRNWRMENKSCCTWVQLY